MKRSVIVSMCLTTIGNIQQGMLSHLTAPLQESFTRNVEFREIRLWSFVLMWSFDQTSAYKESFKDPGSSSRRRGSGGSSGSSSRSRSSSSSSVI